MKQLCKKEIGRFYFAVEVSGYILSATLRIILRVLGIITKFSEDIIKTNTGLEEDLNKLKVLYEKGLITESEYQHLRFRKINKV
ncbi:MAG: hypothetical protein GX312_03675 [Candidatus Phytoplasma sp.]|nr:hypothetical protein [Phytoplasma sp.]